MTGRLEGIGREAGGEEWRPGGHVEDPKPLTVRQVTHYATVPTDADGTPLWNGERMVEVRPGEWSTELYAATAEHLRDLGPD